MGTHPEIPFREGGEIIHKILFKEKIGWNLVQPSLTNLHNENEKTHNEDKSKTFKIVN